MAKKTWYEYAENTLKYLIEALENISKREAWANKKHEEHDKSLKEIRARLWVLENPPRKEKTQ